jgi:peptidoglycan/LPS O-acetylase OafA/YrhL
MEADFLVVDAFPGLVCYSVNTKDEFGKLLNSKFWVALGNWSYSINLWQAPTHDAVMANICGEWFSRQ